MEENRILYQSTKSDKQIFKNYRPILLLPILGKVFEKKYYLIKSALFFKTINS